MFKKIEKCDDDCKNHDRKAHFQELRDKIKNLNNNEDEIEGLIKNSDEISKE